MNQPQDGSGSASKPKYSALDQAYLDIDFRNKTVLLDNRLRDITSSNLTYQEGEIIIDMALNEELP